jgi:hypothetical protein
MPYLNLDLDFFSHPKIVRLSALLGTEASIYPIKLWVWVAKYHAENGMLQGYLKHEIEAMIGWTGEKGALVDAMRKVHLLDECEDGYAIHDWLDHAGFLSVFKKRAKTAAKRRWRRYATSIATSNAQNKTSIAKMQITYAPNHTIPNKKEEQEEPTLDEPVSIESIVALWNRIPGVVTIKTVTGPIRSRLQARIREHPDLAWWTTYFARIRDSAFLTGRTTDFAATLDWVLGPKNMAKILAGNYDKRPSLPTGNRPTQVVL